MIDAIELENFGIIEKLDWQKLGKINLVIGDNGTGKTFLLKSLYTAMRTVEEYKRGDDQTNIAQILYDKLRWTFQPEKFGDLVRKGSKNPLSLNISFDSKTFCYSFGKDTNKSITNVESGIPPRKDNSIFLPAKEVLSLHNIILKSRDQDQVFGFDDTYLDLARALRYQPTKGKNYPQFAKSRKNLENILGGKIEYKEGSNSWQFKNKGNQTFSMGITAEGVKKIAILDTLLGNRYLTPNSIVFIDEPESALHPKAISQLLDIIAALAESGMQFFLASHSYFVIKKLYLISQQKEMSIPIISAETWHSEDLQNGMIDNPIIDESIRLYKEEIDLV
jgi:AAA15 family ATPase/GTPase